MANKQNILKIGIPSGHLREFVEVIFQKAGWELKVNRKLSTVYIDDSEIECLLGRPKELSILVNESSLDAAVISRVSMIEAAADLEVVKDLGTASPLWNETKLVLAVPENSSIKSVKDLEGKKIITRVPEITKNFLKKNKIKASVEFSDDSNEPRVPAFADALVEFTNTGEAFRHFKLRIIEVLMKDSLLVVTNKSALKNNWKKEKIENLALLLKGARLGEEMVGLMLHASNDMMESVFKVLPSLKKPTVTHLRGENWFDVFTVVNEKKVKELIPQLKMIGCTDIIEIPLNKVVV